MSEDVSLSDPSRGLCCSRNRKACCAVPHTHGSAGPCCGVTERMANNNWPLSVARVK